MGSHNIRLAFVGSSLSPDLWIGLNSAFFFQDKWKMLEENELLLNQVNVHVGINNWTECGVEHN